MEKPAGRRVYQQPRGKRAVLGEREKRRLLQLLACLLLFFTIFFAKGADKLSALRQELQGALGSDVDFQAAFADLGWSLASGRSVRETMGELWVDVFIPKQLSVSTTAVQGPLYRSVRQDIPLAAQLVDPEEARPADPLSRSGSRRSAPQSEQPVAPSEPEPEVIHVDYTGPALPENTSMDRYALGLAQTVSPVLAVESSGFGWRNHPIENEERFHYGVDLAADTGTTVKAFAAGTVDYIGESDVYGQYLQLDHGNGIKSFYAHCSRLCVQQGQPVAAGEKVAESGATGDVTGPHLHFELKRDGVRINPEYYIETRS